ncbi:MAG: hypothetical protein ACOYOU_05635 [Kiritimatiellia bacterium]
MANIPYLAMLVLGAATITCGYGLSASVAAAAVAYLAYGIVGAIWIMIFVCPYCDYYGNRCCPCGYGVISARLVAKKNQTCFPEKFRRHIPVIVPLWLIPMVCGGIAIWFSFSWWLASLFFVFVIESCVILPLVSKKHACTACPQKDSCPWMKTKPNNRGQDTLRATAA